MTESGGRPDDVQASGTGMDLGAVLSGLRHLDPSGEPARVFAGLAEACVPGLADECVIWISEQGRHPYRIRRASPGVPAGAAVVLDGMLTTTEGSGTTVVTGSAAGAAAVEITDHAVIARFVSPPWLGGPDYRGVLVCRWHTDHRPDHTKAALLGVMVDHATALVQRERSTVTESAHPTQPAGSALPATQRIAAASGILMALYRLSPTQAGHLLGRASEHTHCPVIDVADTVLRTGGLPASRPGRATCGARPVQDELDTESAGTVAPPSNHQLPSAGGDLSPPPLAW